MLWTLQPASLNWRSIASRARSSGVMGTGTGESCGVPGTGTNAELGHLKRLEAALPPQGRLAMTVGSSLRCLGRLPGRCGPERRPQEAGGGGEDDEDRQP